MATIGRPAGSPNRTPAEIQRDAQIALLKARVKILEEKKKKDEAAKKKPPIKTTKKD